MLEEDESTSHSSIEESVIFLSLSLCLCFSTSSSSSLATADVSMLPIFHPLVEHYISDLAVLHSFIVSAFVLAHHFFLSQNFHQALLFVLFKTLSHSI